MYSYVLKAYMPINELYNTYKQLDIYNDYIIVINFIEQKTVQEKA